MRKKVNMNLREQLVQSSCSLVVAQTNIRVLSSHEKSGNLQQLSTELDGMVALTGTKFARLPAVPAFQEIYFG